MTQNHPIQNHLMFTRTARNHIDNGYFPTDNGTLDGIIRCLDIAGDHIRIFDPCCGEGLALAHIGAHLTECGSDCATFGVELNAERTREAKQHLSHVVNTDIENCILQARTVGLLFLNPPYGYATKDQLSNERAQRLEEMFFSKTAGVLQDGGILVLVVPSQSLTERFTREIASYFIELRIFKAAVDTYKQYVIIGIRPKNRRQIGKKLADEQQRLLLDYENAPPLDTETDYLYEVPQAVSRTFRPMSFEVTHDVLQEELDKLHQQTLWPQFAQWFGNALSQEKRRPLCTLGQWHSALALAAGQVSGIVTAKDGRKLLIKGSTHKTKVVTVDEEEDAKGNTVTTTTALDRFVPSIRAVNLTENSPEYGCVLTIK